MSLLTRPQTALDWPWRMERPFFPWSSMWDGAGEFDVRIEEFERDNHYVIRAEVPGIDVQKNVELTVANNQLQLIIHRERHEKSGDVRHYRTEFQYGSFTRIVPLPRTASEKDVKANYRDGILEIVIKMNGTPAHGHRVPITTD